ncbi:MAG TPA: molybdopterin-guanine dinucleotide biosynthesis protein B [Gammaproteobacteria bacterium]|nr:molybdopterin-guanine dinucleotide biosynthesis protein B [Gammaproteobacteria bacterium]
MDITFTRLPVLGFAAYSGSGKTTLLEQLLPLLADRGVRVGIIKHSHHDFEIDRPGKDSYRLRKAGAQQMLIASPHRTALIEEHTDKREPQLNALLEQLHCERLDLVLVEGFRHVAFAKIEVHRAATGKPLLHPDDASIIAVACDTTLDTHLPRLDLNRPQDIVEFILDFINTTHSGATP